ncbi:MAG: penicillin-binding transpeptidase domain-containing protein [Pseudomonadota bacterium]
MRDQHHLGSLSGRKPVTTRLLAPSVLGTTLFASISVLSASAAHERAPAPVLAPIPLSLSSPQPPGSARSPESPFATDESAVLFGDSHLRGQIDLALAQETNGHLEAPLGNGMHAILTLSPSVQARAESVLSQAAPVRGAIVVMTIDGRLLALAGHDADRKGRALEPALEPWAPAASVFKIVTSAALLDGGVAPSANVCFHGGLRSVEQSNLVDDPKHDRSCQTFAQGLAASQNAVFGKLAARHLDRDTLESYARLFGFGQAPAFALAAPAPTVSLPNTNVLELARAAAGFWHSYLSPIGGAILANTVASGGLAVEPRIVAEVVGPGSSRQPIVAPAPRRVLSSETAETLGEMLTATTKIGTARKGFHDNRGRPYLGDTKVAGKTGSLAQQDPYVSFSWFVGFAPADNPRLVVSVLLGNSAVWRLKAHTAARIVLESALDH